MGFNPFFSYTREQCVEAIADIQDRLAGGVQQSSHSGSGSVQFYTPEVDAKHLRHLANRLADIDGVPRPSASRVRAFVVEHVGYR